MKQYYLYVHNITVYDFLLNQRTRRHFHILCNGFAPGDTFVPSTNHKHDFQSDSPSNEYASRGPETVINDHPASNDEVDAATVLMQLV